jgi:hypothetical protein
MGWKFWERNETAAAPSTGNSKKLEKPRELPQEVGRHLVAEQDLDPDWIWNLKCVRKPKESSKSAFNIRIFSPENVAQHNVKVSDFASLDNHMDLVIFDGWYDKENRTVKLDRTIKEAV